MEGGHGGGGGGSYDAPPIGELWMMDGPAESSRSDAGDGMGDGMDLPYELGGDFWLQGSESSWSPAGDASSHDSDSEGSLGGSGGDSSGSEAVMAAGSGGPGQFDMGFGGSTSPSSDRDSSSNDTWPGLGGWIAMEPGDTDSLSSDSYEYDSVAPPAVGQVAHAMPAGATADGWGVGSDMVTNPAAQPKRGYSATGGSVPAKRPRRPSAAAAVAAPVVATEAQFVPDQGQPSPVPGGSMALGQTLRWEEALHLLNHGIVVPRPSRLRLMPGSEQQIFLERPMQRRKRGDDKWVGSGGRKGSTEYWMEDVGVCKRYGRVACDGPGAQPLKYAHYTRLQRKASGEAVEDKSVALYVAIPKTGAKVDLRPRARGVGAAAAVPLPLPSHAGSSSATGGPALAAAGAVPLPHAPPPKRERAKDLPTRVVPAPHVFTATTGDDSSAALTVQAGAAGVLTPQTARSVQAEPSQRSISD